MSLPATERRVVQLEYELYDADENKVIFSTTEEGEAVEVMFGAGALVPGLEEALEGQTAGYAFDVTLEPEDAYGEYNDEDVEEGVPLDEFPPDVKEGDTFYVGEEDEEPVPFTVVEIDRKSATAVVDYNHPLADLRVRFKGRIVSVREPTAEEAAEYERRLAEEAEDEEG